MSGNTKKSAFNIVFGIAGQILVAVVGILVPRLFITNFGSEMNGFMSSINQVFSYIVLLEAGVGTATLQALYRPVATDDKEKINGILSATAKFYRRTGFYYMLCVLALAVTYPAIVKSQIPVWQQVGVILIVGSGGAVGYFVHAKLRMLLVADGRQYIYTNAYTIVQVGTSLSKVIMISLGMNVVFVQLGHFVLMLGLAAYITRYCKRKYPWLNMKSTPDFKSISQKNSVLIHEISAMIFNHTDVIILTFFADLRVVSVYSLYVSTIDIISNVISHFNNGFTYRLGQIYNTDVVRYRKVYAAYETCYMMFSMALYCITYIFLLPFMRLYTADVTDVNYLAPLLPVLFITIKILVSGRAIAGSTITYAGHFKKTQWRSLIESGINLLVSILGVIYLGIYGVILGTITALLYRTNDMLIYANRKVLSQSPLNSYLRWVVNILTFVIVAVFIQICIPVQADNYFVLIGKAVLYGIVICSVFFIVNFISFRKQFRLIFSYISKMKVFRRFFKKSNEVTS